MNIYKRYLTTLILIGIIGIGIDSVWDSLFLYQATQCYAQFVIHSKGTALKSMIK